MDAYRNVFVDVFGRPIEMPCALMAEKVIEIPCALMAEKVRLMSECGVWAVRNSVAYIRGNQALRNIMLVLKSNPSEYLPMR
jgi:hypothetical protein